VKQTRIKLLAVVFALLTISGSADGGETRTVTGAFTTTFRLDDGSETTLSTPPPFHQTGAAILVLDDSPTGYTSFPITLDADYTFEVPGVPTGTYFLRLDTPAFAPSARNTHLFEMTVDTPDLSSISAARPDLKRASAVYTPVMLNLANLEPWELKHNIGIYSSQADVYWPPVYLSPALPLGVTSHSLFLGWTCCGLFSHLDNPFGLPDASRNDAVFVVQRSYFLIGSGSSAATLGYPIRYARVTDFTLADGGPGTLTAPLVDAPQTGRLRADVRGSQFAALASDVNPTARPATQSIFGRNLTFSVVAVPRSVNYPEMPLRLYPGIGHERSHSNQVSLNLSSSTLYFISHNEVTSDFDYGTFAYPQFHEALWAELREVYYGYDVTFFEPDSDIPLESPVAAYTISWVPMSPAPIGPIAPAIGPPSAPLINGIDAFQAQRGVGEQPVISWSPPAVGIPTSYTVNIFSAGGEPADTYWLSAEIHTGTSFRVPPGFLKRGTRYVATITARQAPWDVLNRAPLRTGAPFNSADCVFGIFSP
jgi:hypothetical protein